MRAPLHLDTTRLTLAAPTAADAEAIFARYASDREVTRYVGWPRHHSVDDARAFIAFSDVEWARAPAGPYLIRDRADGRLLGGTGLAYDGSDRAMTGYVFARDAWGRGYATEALLTMVDLARTLGLRQLSAFCHADHAASRRVLEKGGFVQDPGWNGRVDFPNLWPGDSTAARRFERHM